MTKSDSFFTKSDWVFLLVIVPLIAALVYFHILENDFDGEQNNTKFRNKNEKYALQLKDLTKNGEYQFNNISIENNRSGRAYIRMRKSIVTNDSTTLWVGFAFYDNDITKDGKYRFKLQSNADSTWFHKGGDITCKEMSDVDISRFMNEVFSSEAIAAKKKFDSLEVIKMKEEAERKAKKDSVWSEREKYSEQWNSLWAKQKKEPYGSLYWEKLEKQMDYTWDKCQQAQKYYSSLPY